MAWRGVGGGPWDNRGVSVTPGPVSTTSAPIPPLGRARTAAGDAYLSEIVRDRSLGVLATFIRWTALLIAGALLLLRVAPRTTGTVVAAVALVVIATWRSFVPIRVEGRPAGLGAIGIELLLTVVAVSISGGWDSAFVLTPATPVVIAGLGSGYVATIGATIVAIGGIIVGELITGGVSDHARSGAQLTLVYATISAACGFARGLALDIQRRQAREASDLRRLGEVNDLLRALQSLSRSLPARLDLTDVLASTRDQIRRITEYHALVVLLRREATSDWSVEMADGTSLHRTVDDAALPPAAVIALADDRVVLETDLLATGHTGLSPSARSALYIPLIAGERTTGLLALEHRRPRAFGADEVRILSGLATPVALAVDNAVMFASIRTLAAEEERARIARELHDDFAQSLAYVSFELERLGAENDDPQIDQLRDVVHAQISDLRLALYDLRVTVDDRRSLRSALEDYTRHWAARTGIQLDLRLPSSDRRLPLPVERELLRIAQEALTNVERHADASECRLSWEQTGSRTRLEVVDNGRGFRGDAERDGHYGLTGMDERAAAIDAHITLWSAPGRGTRVTVEVECPQ